MCIGAIELGLGSSQCTYSEHGAWVGGLATGAGVGETGNGFRGKPRCLLT